MSKVLISESTLQSMANVVREKTGTSETLKPSEMVVEVATITPLNGQTKTITPTTSSQTITPDSGYNGITQVNVNAVTNSIDANIVASNIKKDVQILGVTGTYEGSGGGEEELKEMYKQMSSELENAIATDPLGVNVTDSAYWRTSITLGGKIEQDWSEWTYKCSGTETGDYKFTINNFNRYFTMPTVSAGDMLIFNTTDSTLKLNGTTNITWSSGYISSTTITFTQAPNPDYEKVINTVTGSNSIKISNRNLIPELLVGMWDVTEPRSLINTTSTKYISFKVNTRAGKYTLSCNNSLTIVKAMTDKYTDIGTEANITTKTFTRNENETIYITVCRYDGSDWSSSDLLQFERGDTATTYVKHEEQNYPIDLGTLELCGLQNYYDKIFKNEPNSPYYDSTLVENGWYKYCEINKIVFDGSQEINKVETSYSPYGYAYYILFSPKVIYTNADDAINHARTNYFKAIGNYYAQLYHGCATTGSAGNRALFGWNGTSEQLKTFLTNNPCDFYYCLVTPLKEQITDTNLIEQLEDLYKATTYLGGVDISQTYNNQPFVITLDYKKSNLLRIKDLESIQNSN